MVTSQAQGHTIDSSSFQEKLQNRFSAVVVGSTDTSDKPRETIHKRVDYNTIANKPWVVGIGTVSCESRRSEVRQYRVRTMLAIVVPDSVRARNSIRSPAYHSRAKTPVLWVYS